MMDPPSEEPFRLDGNSAAGVLQEVFAMEMTSASSTCPVCGRISAVGALHLYGGAMGFVLRCPSCEALMLCITNRPAGYLIDVRGMMHVHPNRP